MGELRRGPHGLPWGVYWLVVSLAGLLILVVEWLA